MNWKSVVQQLSTSLPLRKFYTFANRVPILGSALKNFSRTAIPSDTLVWTSIRSGPGKGLWIRLNPRYEMEYIEGEYEAPVEQVLLSNLRPGTVFYDVGAHIGVFSLIAARNLGSHGSVLVFEPDPSNVRRIKEHAARNQLDAIRIKLPAVLKDLQYNATLNASQALVDTTRRNLLPQMLLDAKVKAAALAEAASLKLGAIQGVTESYYGSGYNNSPFFAYSAVLSATSYSASGSGTQYNFTVAVKFGVQ